MKKLFLSLGFTLLLFTLSAQEKSVKGPVFKKFGTVYKIKDPDLLLDKNKTYKVIFDVYTDADDKTKMNPNINTVARFINMHAQNGIKTKNLKIVLVLHGAATKNALSESAFKKHYQSANPNAEILKQLKKAGVQTYVCGQSYTYKKFKRNELSKNVQLSLSALTALVNFQSQGYSLITFN